MAVLQEEYQTPTQLAVARRERAQAMDTGILPEQTMTKKAIQKKRKMVSCVFGYYVWTVDVHSRMRERAMCR